MGKAFSLLSLLLVLCVENSYAQPTTLTQIPIPPQLRSVAVLDIHQSNPDHIIVSDSTQVFRSESFGMSWENVFTVERPHESIVQCTFDRDSFDAYYVLTTRALYQVKSGEVTEVYRSHDAEITACDQDPFTVATLVLGTTQGLLVSYDAGEQWQPVSRIMRDRGVKAVSFHPNIVSRIFVACDDSIFIGDVSEGRVEERKVGESALSEDLGDEVVDASDEGSSTMFAFPLGEDNTVYLLRDEGVVVTHDGGMTWRPLTLPRDVISGVSGLDVSSSDGEVVLSSPKGLYRYNSATQSLISEVGTIPVVECARYEGALRRCVMTDGVRMYHYEEKIVQELPIQETYSVDDMRAAFVRASSQMRALPSIGALHEHALRYAHLSENRLRGWEIRSRLRSLLPTVAVEIERDTSNNIDIDRGSTSVADTFLDGPDENDTSVGLSVEWDIADLVWNDMETTIEYRRKSFVDQRDDILHEITRLYYEYLRIKAELLLVDGIKNADGIGLGSPIDYVQKLVRCQEIIAHLDGLTGGAVFSQKKALS